jgi:hypothetical protein
VGNVKSMATLPNGDQGWKCQVCGKYFLYSQPINYRLLTQMGLLFTNWHDDNCKAPVVGKEVAGG